MTRLRTGTPWMPAPEFSRQLTGLNINLIVVDVDASLPFFTDVLELKKLYSDPDFAAFEGPQGWHLMLHADHTLDHSPSETARLSAPGKRGTGAEIRLMGFDPDAVEKRARALGFTVNVPAATYPHGWREVRLEDANGYMFAVGVATIATT